eukprot:gene7120-2897_t
MVCWEDATGPRGDAAVPRVGSYWDILGTAKHIASGELCTVDQDQPWASALPDSTASVSLPDLVEECKLKHLMIDGVLVPLGNPFGVSSGDGGDRSSTDLGNGGVGGWTCSSCYCQNLGANSICHHSVDSGYAQKGQLCGCPVCDEAFLDLISLATHMKQGCRGRGASGGETSSGSSRGGGGGGGGGSAVPDYLSVDQLSAGVAPPPMHFWACSKCRHVNAAAAPAALLVDNAAGDDAGPRRKVCKRCANIFATSASNWVCINCTCVNPPTHTSCCGCESSLTGTLKPSTGTGMAHVQGLMVKGATLKMGTIRGGTMRGDTVNMRPGRSSTISFRNSRRSNESIAQGQMEYILKFCLGSLYMNGRFPQTHAPVAHAWLSSDQIIPNDGGSKTKWTLFKERGQTSPSDIVQGALGNCWFLSALTVLAEKPELVDNLFITKEYSPVGAYQLQLFVEGNWETALTGCPCQSIFLGPTGLGDIFGDEADKLWERLISYKRSGFLMGASVDSSDESTCERVGLVSNHAYSILDLRVEGSTRLIRFRNPWGTSNWAGAWADSSAQWTPELRDKLQAFGAEEGYFWGTYSEMLKYFTSIDVCKTRPDWCSVQLNGMFPHTPDGVTGGFQVYAAKPLEIEITLFRGTSSSKGATEQEDIDMGVVVMHASTGLHVMESTFVASSRTSYVIVPVSFSSLGLFAGASGGHQLQCTVHSTEPVLIEEVRIPPQLVGHAVIQQVMAKSKPPRIPIAAFPGMKIYDLDTVFVARNETEKQHFSITMDVVKQSNMASSRQTLSMKDAVPPMHSQLFGAFTPQSRRIKSEFEYRMAYDAVKKAPKPAHAPSIVQGFDVHSPVPILSKKGTFKQKKNDPKSQKEYAKWAGGGVGGGVFGGGSIAASDTDIDAMMAAFLSSA